MLYPRGDVASLLHSARLIASQTRQGVGFIHSQPSVHAVIINLPSAETYLQRC
jgi:hypothetical protein